MVIIMFKVDLKKVERRAHNNLPQAGFELGSLWSQAVVLPIEPPLLLCNQPKLFNELNILNFQVATYFWKEEHTFVWKIFIL